MTSAQLAAKMQRRAATIPSAALAGLEQAGNEALAAGKQAMEEKIYGHSIPTTKSGKPKWVQTRNLINHERKEVVGMTVRLVNDMVYARRRHELKKPQTRWPAHWRDEALARAKEQFSSRIVRSIVSVLERR